MNIERRAEQVAEQATETFHLYEPLSDAETRVKKAVYSLVNAPRMTHTILDAVEELLGFADSLHHEWER